MKRDEWETYNIRQGIALSLAEIDRNEPLLAAASYFWSEALNAFLFGHGPMTPTLADVLMLTGLNVTELDKSLTFLDKSLTFPRPPISSRLSKLEAGKDI